MNSSFNCALRNFVHSRIYDLLKSQIKFPASYQKYRFVLAYKRDLGAKFCRIIVKSPETQYLHQDKHQKACRSRE